MTFSLLQRFERTSLKNKIFLSTTLVILLISLVIALFTRWILVSSLTGELQRRGLGIAHSLAESCRTYLLTEDRAQLASLVFDSRLGDRRQLIHYVFIHNKDHQVVAHTFMAPFPGWLSKANRLAPEAPYQIRLLETGGTEVYDVAVPVKEGIYTIGTIHVGLYKKHIDLLIGKLRTTFLGFLSAVTVIVFLISLRLSRYITRPISELTKVADEISRGNFDIRIDQGEAVDCRILKDCRNRDCPAWAETSIACWYLKADDSDCAGCKVYRNVAHDEVGRLASSFANMTRQIRRSQARLTESEAKYRSLFASGPNPIFVLDRSSLEILDANPIAEDFYGFSRTELIGRCFSDLGPFDFSANWRDLENGAPGHPVIVSSKVHCRSKDGRDIYVNVHASLASYQNRPALIVATTNITELVEKDSQLIQASKMKNLGEMSAGIAHELNQPLNAIKMGSQLLELVIEGRVSLASDGVRTAVVEINRQVNRAAEIIQRLREFGRKSDLDSQELSLNQAVESVLRIIGRQLALQNIQVTSKLQPDLPPVRGQFNRLEQVVFNLLTNARDALMTRPDAGQPCRIEVRTYTEDQWVVLSVADNGAGIADHIKENIFEAFFTTKEMGEGMGLGLSISAGIIQDHGGSIQVESTPGNGATFYIRLPVVL